MGRPPVGGGRQPHLWHPSELSALWLISDPPIGTHPCNLGLRHGSRQRQDLVEAGGDLREGFRPCVLVLKAPRPHPVPSLEVLALHRRAPSLVPLSRRAWGVGKVGGGETGVSWDCGTREGLSPAHVRWLCRWDGSEPLCSGETRSQTSCSQCPLPGQSLPDSICY